MSRFASGVLCNFLVCPPAGIEVLNKAIHLSTIVDRITVNLSNIVDR